MSIILLLIVLGDVIILARRCSKSKYNYSIEKCTDNDRLVQKFVSSLSLHGGGTFKVKTARGQLCLCNTNKCNDVPAKEFKNKMINTAKQTTMSDLDIDGVLDTSTDSTYDVTDSTVSYASSSHDFDDVTDYWMNYTGFRGATVKHTYVSDRIEGQLSDVSTVYSLTTRGLAAQHDTYNSLQLMFISIAVYYFKF